MTTILRDRLTPFGDALAEVLPREPVDGVTMRVVSAADAAEPMRHVLKRLNLTEKKRIIYKDGTLGASWYDEPTLYIHEWINSESAIVVKDDAEGPVAIEFDMRLAAATFKVVYRIGDAPGHAALLRAYWDLGLRRSIWEFHEDRTPSGYVARVQERYAALEGVALAITPRGDGWVDYVLTMTAKPERPTTR
jgi:hypothetical protein